MLVTISDMVGMQGMAVSGCQYRGTCSCA